MTIEIPDWLAARRAQSPDSNSIEWDALRCAQELFERNRDGLMSGDAFNANVTPIIELVQLVRAMMIKAQKFKSDRYELALRMIREGAENPASFAARVLEDKFDDQE